MRFFMMDGRRIELFFILSGIYAYYHSSIVNPS